jgi:Tol biopolymer transport system component
VEKGACTPDGKWVLYTDLQANDGKGQISKVSIDGGSPVELVRGIQFSPPVSPDGKLIAYAKTEGQGSQARSKIEIQKLDDGTILTEVGLPPTYTWHRLAWTPDGKALTFVHNTTGSTQDVYMQPLSGGEPVQLTHFEKSIVVPDYAWSGDGKKFAVTRGHYNDTDVVMFSGFK